VTGDDDVDRLVREWAEEPPSTLPEFVDDGARTKVRAAIDHLSAALVDGVDFSGGIRKAKELLDVAERIGRLVRRGDDPPDRA